MRQVFFKITYITMALVVLSSCSLQKATRNAGEAVIPQAPAPSMAPMKYTWNTNYSAMLSPPREIREKALEACAQRGFDRADMQTISINEDQATAYFSCRGSDQ